MCAAGAGGAEGEQRGSPWSPLLQGTTAQQLLGEGEMQRQHRLLSLISALGAVDQFG